MRPEALIGKGLGELCGLVHGIGAEIKRTYEGCSLDTIKSVIAEFRPNNPNNPGRKLDNYMQEHHVHWEYHTAEETDLDHAGWGFYQDEDDEK